MQWRKISSLFWKQNVSTGTSQGHWEKPAIWLTDIFTFTTMNVSKTEREWRRWRYATPLKIQLSCKGNPFLCCPHKLGQSICLPFIIHMRRDSNNQMRCALSAADEGSTEPNLFSCHRLRDPAFRVSSFITVIIHGAILKAGKYFSYQRIPYRCLRPYTEHS